MTVYVDALIDWGWKIRGATVKSCHMFTDEVDEGELHRIAMKIGMRRSWYQDHPDHPHYDLTEGRRRSAVAEGAVELDRKKTVEMIRMRRAKIGDFKHLPCPSCGAIGGHYITCRGEYPQTNGG